MKDEVYMRLAKILLEIDTEIAKLKQARALLNGETKPAGKPGRPKKEVAAVKTAKKTKGISAEGRARIAAAQRKRWAAAKKAA
jgi:hypothetical protein